MVLFLLDYSKIKLALKESFEKKVDLKFSPFFGTTAGIQ
jgi:hypothetical protein